MSAYINGVLTVALHQLPALLAEADRIGDIAVTTIEDLVRLLGTCAGDPAPARRVDTTATLHEEPAVEIALTTEHCELSPDWPVLMQMCARHGARAEFTHEASDDHAEDPYRTRVQDGTVHRDECLDHVFTGDILGYIGQLGTAEGLDFLTPLHRTENAAAKALCAELHARTGEPAPPERIDHTNAGAVLRIHAARTAVAYAIGPVLAP